MTLEELLKGDATTLNDWYAQQQGYNPVYNEDGRLRYYSTGEEGKWNPEDEGTARSSYRDALLKQFKTAFPNTVPLGDEFSFGKDTDYSFWGVGDRDAMMQKYQGAGSYGTDPTTGIEYFKPNSGVVNPFPDYNPAETDFLAKALPAIWLGMAGGSALGLFGDAAGAASVGGSALPESYWSMLAEGAGSGLPSAAAGTIGSSGITAAELVAQGLSAADLAALGYPAAEITAAGATAAGTANAISPSLLQQFQNLLTPSPTSLANSAATQALTGDRGADFNEFVNDYGVNPGGLQSYTGSNATDWASIFSPRSPYLNLAGSAIQGLGSIFGANAQADAAQNANNTTWAMYNQNRADLEPWRTAGVGALGKLVDMTTPGKQFTTMQADPGYQFRLEEGTNALNNRLKAGGKFYSGQAIKGGQDYAQNFASNEFNNVYNRLAGLAGTGQAATNTTAGLGENAAKLSGANENAMGAARASGYGGLAGAVVGGLNRYNNSDFDSQLLALLARRSV